MSHETVDRWDDNDFNVFKITHLMQLNVSYKDVARG